jgi:hypothetical protein
MDNHRHGYVAIGGFLSYLSVYLASSWGIHGALEESVGFR